MYSPRWLFFYPGLLLMLAGLILFSLLAFTPLAIRGVVLDIHTLLYAAVMVPTGFQAVLFAVYSNKFAVGEGLVPGDPAMNRFARLLKLESGLIVGVALVIGGLAGTGVSLFRWWQTG